MDSQMQANFLNHMLKFFAPKEKDEGNAVPDVDVPSTPSAPDLPILVGMLLSAGFDVKYSDKGERGGSSAGCRAIIICQRSGTRVVMQGEGPCTCPSEEALNNHLHPPGRAGQAPSRATSPTPSAVGQLEDPLNISMTSTTDDNALAPPRLTRQRTWSRDGDSASGSATQDTASPVNRRLSAPPGSLNSQWTTLQGDELNVMAATDLLQEAMCLLTGVKKPNLRNTPVGPSRRLSAVSRRMSTDRFAQPLRPLSRTSSASSSSGLGSVQSTSSHSDTPRPPRPTASTCKMGPETLASVRNGPTLRRTISACAGTGTTATTALSAKARQTPTTSLLNRTKSDANKKGPPEASSGTQSVVTKVTSLIKPPSTTTKPFTRPSLRAGIKTNASLIAKPSQPKTVSKSPEMESIKL
ncbi:mucin-3A-like [Thrips palmi]|uniref:Mucin-3A-like n=1 Tax=Thrips palmi TaxID=161013 RepID=A0A6P8ZVK0_THRPL|nr:mucin-3A-like [Thrips palmi]